MEKIINDLENILETKKIYKDKSLKEYTSFKVGGSAKILVEVESVNDLINVIKYINENNKNKENEHLKKYIIGAGTNVVFSSEGFDGIVIKISIEDIELISENEIKAGAGLKLMKLCKYASSYSLGNISQIYGIPGSIGGAIKMNAGAFGLEIKDIISEVIYLDEDLKINRKSVEDLDFSYRHSLFTNNDYIILYGIFKLNKIDKKMQIKEMEEIMEKRISNQPLDFPSAGSVFKRGENFITSKLIDDLGLKGRCVGDAEVSIKHAGFIINKGNATSLDIINLVKIIKQEALEKAGKKLETEIIFVEK